MAKFKEKQIALDLRKAGKSYSQIKQIVGVSKSTLSFWLRDYPLPLEKIRELRDWNQTRIENYRETRRKKKELELRSIYNREKREIFPLSARDIFIGGLFLYWGEGSKTRLSEICLSNTNPAIIKSFIYWLLNNLKVDKKNIKIKLHLYNDMDIKTEIIFWSRILRIPYSQFKKPYVKKSNRSSLTYKNGFNHGTCNVVVGNAILGKKILMGLETMKDFFIGT